VEIHAKDGENKKFYVYDSFGAKYTNLLYANSDTGEVVQAAVDDKGRVRVDSTGSVLFLRWKPPGGVYISPKKSQVI
jgi:hypothetical protein